MALYFRRTRKILRDTSTQRRVYKQNGPQRELYCAVGVRDAHGMREGPVVYFLVPHEVDVVRQVDQKEYDPALCKSEKSGRGPLAKDWVEKSEPPVMCCYKLVRVDFKVWGLQGKTENLVAQSQKKLFLKTHGQVFAQLDNYFDMKMSDIREMEDNAQKKLQDMKDAAEKAKAAAADDAKKPAAKS